MYSMKTNTKLIVLAVVLLVVLLIASIYSCCNFVPYSSADLFKKEYKYEGFREKMGDETEEKKEEEEKEEMKIEGFTGLQPSPFVEEKKVDTISSKDASIDCIPDSMGYSKSTGGLCLSKEDQLMILTRGGNSKSGESQIGGSV